MCFLCCSTLHNLLRNITDQVQINPNDTEQNQNHLHIGCMVRPISFIWFHCWSTEWGDDLLPVAIVMTRKHRHRRKRDWWIWRKIFWIVWRGIFAIQTAASLTAVKESIARAGTKLFGFERPTQSQRFWMVSFVATIARDIRCPWGLCSTARPGTPLTASAGTVWVMNPIIPAPSTMLWAEANTKKITTAAWWTF